MPDDPLKVSNSVTLNADEIILDAVRAQGPGGQKVNKTSSAIHLRYDIHASSLPDFYKERLLELDDGRITKEGVIVIKAQRHRTREQNKEEAISRLVELIGSVNVTRKKRIATRPSYSAVKKRLQAKKKQGEKKKQRGKVKE